MRIHLNKKLVPYNIASYATLHRLIAKECGYSVGFLNGFFGDLHLYEDHIDIIKNQIKSNLFSLPELDISNTSLFNFNHKDVLLNNYNSNEIFKYKLFT